MTAVISQETLRPVPRAGNVSWKTTTTWRASTDPEFIARRHRILALYDNPNLMPRKGKAWGAVRRPRRLRATYHRTDGVLHMLVALNLCYRIHRRKRWCELLGLLKALRAR